MKRTLLTPALAPRRQHGISVIAAIFLLLLFAALAAFMANLSGMSSLGAAQDVQGERAFHAAQGGLEWGIHQVLVPPAASCAASTPLSLGDFNVEVSCQAFGPYTEAGQTFSLYRLRARACSHGCLPAAVGSSGFVEREVQATVTR